MENEKVPDSEAIRNITVRFAARSKAVQQSESCEFGETVDGRRVVISTDGGRILFGRISGVPKRRKAAIGILPTGGSLNEGRMERKFSPFINGTVKGPDAVFGLLRFYLSKLKLSTADQILFVADGSHWIWRRVPKLLEDLGVHLKRAYELVDFYHAVEHLGKFPPFDSKMRCWKNSYHFSDSFSSSFLTFAFCILFNVDKYRFLGVNFSALLQIRGRFIRSSRNPGSNFQFRRCRLDTPSPFFYYSPAGIRRGPTRGTSRFLGVSMHRELRKEGGDAANL